MVRKFTAAAAALMALVAPSWAVTISYNGSADPTTLVPAWFLYEGVIQGIAFDEGGGNFSWHLTDSSAYKTKLAYSAKDGIAVNQDIGAYLESRMKCGSGSSSTTNALNFAIYVKGTAKRDLTIRPTNLYMDGKTYNGTFTDYHVIRMCYKKLDLRTRGVRRHTWAVYVDGSPEAVLWTPNSAGAENVGGPLWGAGSTSSTQDLYFDYVNYDDAGAFPPGMDGTVTFVNGDPDGRCSSDGTSLTISWETNVPTTGVLYYKPQGGVAYASASDPTLSTTHSITVSGTVAGQYYDYYVVSTDGSGNNAVSLPTDIWLNPFYISSGPSAAVTNALSVPVTWETSLPDLASEVHYGLWPDVIDTAFETPAGGKTSHSVTIPTLPGNLYYYFVKSTHSSWPAVQSGIGGSSWVLQTFSTSIPDDEYLDNIGFEIPDTLENRAKTPGSRDIGPWVKFGGFDGIYRMFELGAWTPKLAYCAGSVEHSRNSQNGAGLYQAIPTTPGQFYEAKVYIWTRRQAGTAGEPTQDPSKPLDVACRIGIDPMGGTDPGQYDAATGTWIENPNISWSDWTETANSCTDNDSGGNGGPWTEISATAKAVNTTATVFLQQMRKYQLFWNISGFDDASFAVTAAPPATINETKKLKNGSAANLVGKVVTASWFTGNDNSFYIEEQDRSSGVHVIVPLISGIPVPAVGSLADVSGHVQTSQTGEREIIAWAVTENGAGTVPAPFGMTNATVGSITNTGLLVRTCGKVILTTLTDPNNKNFFVIDDGSAVPGYKTTGLKVTTDTYPILAVDQYVAVTGISSLEWLDPTQGMPGDEYSIRILRIRDDNDIQTITPP